MDGCVKTHRAQQGLAIFQDMKHNPSVKISNVTYSILVRMYAQLGDVDGAFSLLDEIKSRRMTPSIVVFTCLSQICVKYKMPQDLLWIFDQANRVFQIQIDSIFVKIVLQGLLTLNALNEALCVIKDLLRAKKTMLLGEQGNFVLQAIEKQLKCEHGHSLDRKLLEGVCHEIRVKAFKHFNNATYDSLLQAFYRDTY